MPCSPSSRPAHGAERVSLYDEITTRIIGELEAGRLPWVQPWGASGVAAPLAMPRNAATGRGYSGINVLILWGAVIARGFSCQSWLTFRQALGLGGNVRKGERGTTVVFADRFVPDDEKRRSRETGEDAHAIPFLKRFTVFSTDQCEGLPDDLATAPPPLPEGLIQPEVEALIRASGADLRLGGNKAFYAPGLDYIQVPRPEAYFEPIQLPPDGAAIDHVRPLLQHMPPLMLILGLVVDASRRPPVLVRKALLDPIAVKPKLIEQR